MHDHWVHLRLCMICGHVGCCDSSKNKHATKHFHSSRHPIMSRSSRANIGAGATLTNSSLNLLEWPSLPFSDWEATCDTVHMWTQIVGKTRLALSPPQNHWWHVPLYVTPRGLTTSPIPFGKLTFDVEFDFVAHQVAIRTSAGQRRSHPFVPAFRGGFLRGVHGLPSSAGDRCDDQPDARGVRRYHSVRRRSSSRFLRSGVRRAIPANTDPRRRSPEGVSLAIPRQVQPGAFLLGILRSVGDAFLRAALLRRL